jgi:hypothetical protein
VYHVLISHHKELLCSSKIPIGRLGGVPWSLFDGLVKNADGLAHCSIAALLSIPV